jgi:hypothetical protein
MNKIAEIRDGALRARVISRIKVETDTSKQTSFGRFSELNETVLELLDKERTNVMHDVAVSSGITSVELYELLRSKGVNFQLYVSDPYSLFYYSDNLITRIYDANKRLVKAYVFNVVADERLRRKFLVSKALFRLVKRGRFDPALKQISLFDRLLVDLVKSGAVSIIDYDIFDCEVRDRFTYVRCMNLLNPEYFSRELLLRGIANLEKSMVAGGILQLGRTAAGGENHVSFYRKDARGLELISKRNNGSEIESMVAMANRHLRR